MEDFQIIQLRIFLLSAIICCGVPANVLSILVNIKSLDGNRLNAIAYLYLASVDLVVCIFHGTIALVLEILNFNSPYYGANLVLYFIETQVCVRVYGAGSLLSCLAVVVIAMARCWRVYHPYSNLKWKRFVSLLGIITTAVVITSLSIDLKLPYNNRALVSQPTNTTVSLCGPHKWNQSVAQEKDEIQLNSCNISLFDLSLVKHNDSITKESFPKNDQNNLFNASRNTTIDSLLLDYEIWSDMDLKKLQNLNVSVKTSDAFDSMDILSWLALAILLGVSTLYAMISFRLLADFRKAGESSRLPMVKFLRREIRHLFTHFMLVVIMILALWPGFYVVFDGSSNSFAFGRLLSSVSVINSAINPYIYCLLIPMNRAKIKTLVSCRGRCVCHSQ